MHGNRTKQITIITIIELERAERSSNFHFEALESNINQWHLVWWIPFDSSSNQCRYCILSSFDSCVPNRVWSKSWLYDPTVGSSWILDHLIGRIFPFKMIVYEPKLELKRVRYHQNTKNSTKIFSLFFKGKTCCFWPNFAL